MNGLVSWSHRLKKRARVNSPGGVHRRRHAPALPTAPIGAFSARVVEAYQGHPVDELCSDLRLKYSHKTIVIVTMLKPNRKSSIGILPILMPEKN